MSETLFYHLERRELEDVLPGLLERTLARGQRALVRVDSADRAEAIDRLLWVYRPDSFLPHAVAGDGDAARQKVLITLEDGNANKAEILFLAGGAMPGSWDGVKDFERIALLFDGRDPDQLARARAAWKDAGAAGHDVTYWKENAAGKFEKQA